MDNGSLPKRDQEPCVLGGLSPAYRFRPTVGDLSALEPNGPDCPYLAVVLPAHPVPCREERKGPGDATRPRRLFNDDAAPRLF